MKMTIDNDKLAFAMAKEGMLLKDICKKAQIGEVAFRAIRQGKSQPRPATIGRIANGTVTKHEESAPVEESSW